MHTKIKAVLTAALLAAAVATPLAAPAEEKDDVKRAAPKAAAEEPYVVEAEIGIGYDSNAYLAPSAGYFDFAQGVFQPTVIQTGFFIPLSLKAKHSADLNAKSRFLTSFKLNADIYPESDTDKADEYDSTLKAGLEFVLGKKERREDTFYVGPFLGFHRDTYVNRDDGVEGVGGDRYSYNSIGLEAEYEKRIASLPYRIHAEIEDRNYPDPVGTVQQDHTYYELGADVDVPLGKRSKANLSYAYYVKDYTDRHARELNTTFSTTTLVYQYHDFGVTLRNKLADWLVVYLDYNYIIRNDDYVGYNDYTKNEYRIRIITREGKGMKLQAWFTYWDRDYPNAFAFDVSGQPQKTYDGIEARVKGDFALDKQWGLWAEYKYWNQNSTDLRYDYDRYQVMAGVKWEM
ncbi:MAG: hypothetical protein AABZ10_12240 [Nitrospirota bacterium]|mgnify:CR=1 FL=1